MKAKSRSSVPRPRGSRPSPSHQEIGGQVYSSYVTAESDGIRQSRDGVIPDPSWLMLAPTLLLQATLRCRVFGAAGNWALTQAGLTVCLSESPSTHSSGQLIWELCNRRLWYAINRTSLLPSRVNQCDGEEEGLNKKWNSWNTLMQHRAVLRHFKIIHNNLSAVAYVV